MDPLTPLPGETPPTDNDISLGAECLAAVTGLFPEPPLALEDGEKAEALLPGWSEKVAALFKRPKPLPFKLPPRPKVDETFDKLLEGVDQETLTALTVGITNIDLQGDYNLQLQRMRDAATAAWPSLSVSTLTGPVYLPPPADELGRALAIYSVLDDPSRIVDELAMGTLTWSQVEAFKDCFPKLYAALGEMVTAQIVEMAAAKKTAPRWLEAAVMTFRLVKSGTPVERVDHAEAPPEPPPAPQVSRDFSQVLTKAESIAAK